MRRIGQRTTLGEARRVSVDSGSRNPDDLNHVKPAPDATKPHLVEGVDILTLAIGPEEAFVLSRVDARSSKQDIAFATGLPAERVEVALRRLAELGAVVYGEYSSRNLAERQGDASPDANDGLSADTLEGAIPQGTHVVSSAAVLPYDPKELEENVDLDIEKKRLILDKYYQVDSMNHYEVLGLTRDADRKSVKTAYYGLVAAIHPDKYFGRNLGHFRQKMEKCFARVTEAYDVLSRQTTRDEYDAYLKSQQQVADLQRALDMRVTAEELDHLERELMRLAESATSNSPPKEADSIAPKLAESVTPRPSVRVLTEQERRQALANALRRNPAGVRSSTNPNSGSPKTSHPDLKASGDGLKQMYEARIQRARQVKLKSHLQSAKEALDRNDPVAAFESLRIAQQLAPDDATIAAHLETVQGQANSVLAERYLEQAEYEERYGRLESASRNYAHAAESRPTAELWEKAARCEFRAKADLRAAVEMTRKAIELAPARGDLHALLAEIYLEAQLNASAAAELERASRLAPNDNSIRELRRRLERSGN
jgi:curved DNA-binding protein CbpA